MTISNFNETEIQITSVQFRNSPTKKRFESYPRRMVMDGREYTFVDGMRYLVQKGQEFIKLFDMTDGENQYRLRVDEANHWTLVGMKAAV
jgi:hypothetical protein